MRISFVALASADQSRVGEGAARITEKGLKFNLLIKIPSIDAN